MTSHRLVATQLIPRPLDEVFAFFATPDNLARITPPSMRFEFVTSDRRMRKGLEIDYRLRPILGIPVSWRTRIDAYDPPTGFSDTQLRGPYRRWNHRHDFRAVDGGTQMTDTIEYSLPFGILGDVIHRRGDRVVVLSRSGEAARGPLPDSIEIRRADVTEPASLAPALEGVDALAIALAFPNSPMEQPNRGLTFDAVDAAGTEHLVAAARQAGVGRVVYVSGAGAAPDAKRHWFRAKWRAEQAVRGSGLGWTIIRPTWIFGPRDVSLNRFVGFARRLPFVPLTNSGRQLLAPVFIDDVARLVADAIVQPEAAGEVFEVGGPETLTMRAIVARALRVAGIRRPILPGPTPLLKLAAWPLQFLPTPPLTPAAVDFVNQPATVDLGPLLQRLPRDLTPLDEGLGSYLGPASGSGSEITIDGLPV